MGWHTDSIAVDWGTTNRRAWRIAADGEIIDGFDDDLGVSAVPEGGFDAAVAGIRARLGDVPMLLAGMVGSNRGWREAPYVPCPADLAALAAAILWVEPGRTGLVPGVAQASPPDVMRGEEVQVFGAAAMGLLPPDALVCHPGTHAKWIHLSGGQISAFRTQMTGELFALLRDHSILADALAPPVETDDAFLTGVDEALAGTGLLSGLFAVRARRILEPGAGGSASRASGLLIGTDVREGLALGGAGPVHLVGRPDLNRLYAAAIARAGRTATAIDGDAAFLAGIRALGGLL